LQIVLESPLFGVAGEVADRVADPFEVACGQPSFACPSGSASSRRGRGAKPSDNMAVRGVRMEQSLCDERLRVLAAQIEGCRCLPAARRMAPSRWRVSGGPPLAAGYWGRPVAGFGDGARGDRAARARTGRARRQSHRPRLHRRSLRRLPLRGALARRFSQASPVSRARDDGLELRGLFRHCGVRCAPPATGRRRRARSLPAVCARRAGAARESCAWSSVSAASPGTPRWRCTTSASARARGLDTAPSIRRRAAPRCSPATTRASRTPSPARLTEPMIDAVLARARELAGLPGR